MTQCERVLQFMEDYGSISQFEAFTELGVMRLAARIKDLRRQGHRIDGTLEAHTNRYGEKVYCTRYRKAA